MQREFEASAGRIELSFAGFTYLRCSEGLVFFSFVIDAYSRKIVGWQFTPHMHTDARPRCLRESHCASEHQAPDVELVHHSDAGSRYTSIDYTQTL